MNQGKQHYTISKYQILEEYRRQNQKGEINTSEGKLTHNSIRWYEHVLRIIEESFKEGLEHKSERRMSKRRTRIK